MTNSQKPIDPQAIDKKRARRAFSRAAAGYGKRAFLQQEVGRRLFSRLDGLRISPARILDAGCGDGIFLQKLLAQFPSAKAVALDFAVEMLRRGFVGEKWPRIFRIAADVERLPLASASADFVWSNLCYQWANDLPAVFAEAARATSPDGLILFSTLGPDTLMELRAAFAQADSLAHTNRFTDMHDIGDMLVDSGFESPVMECEKLVLTYPTLADGLRELKAVGAGGAHAGMRRTLAGKEQWRRVNEFYRREFVGDDGRFPMTFEVILGHAWRRDSASDGVSEVRFFPRG